MKIISLTKYLIMLLIILLIIIKEIPMTKENVLISEDARDYVKELIDIVSNEKLLRIFEVIFGMPVEYSEDGGYVLDIDSSMISNWIDEYVKKHNDLQINSGELKESHHD